MTNRENMQQRALQLIPRGTHTLRKSVFFDEAFPDYPTHTNGGKNQKLFGVDGKEYVDFVCGLGAVGLGYGYNSEQFLDTVRWGISHSVASASEVELAEILTAMIPFAEQVRVVKTGSEACQGAVRAARAMTGKDRVVVSGYHGWHDWYMASVPDSVGIPSAYRQTVLKIREYDIVGLRNVLSEGNVACVMMEPCRNYEPPEENYFVQVKSLCAAYETLLIFDETLCGFRWALRGGQEYFGVNPDVAIYGKAIANGFPLAAIVGPKEFMQQTWPVSGTYFGDVLSLRGVITTIETYMLHPVIPHMWALGKALQEGMNTVLYQFHRLGEVSVEGYAVNPWFNGNTELINQIVNGLAKQGYLFHPKGFNIMWTHTEADVQGVLDALSKVLEGMK